MASATDPTRPCAPGQGACWINARRTGSYAIVHERMEVYEGGE